MGRRARETGPGEGGWAACGKRKKGADWAGLAVWAERRKRGREKRKVFFLFAEDFKQIQFESKFEEFKFKLNHNIKTMQG